MLMIKSVIYEISKINIFAPTIDDYLKYANYGLEYNQLFI